MKRILFIFFFIIILTCLFSNIENFEDMKQTKTTRTNTQKGLTIAELKEKNNLEETQVLENITDEKLTKCPEGYEFLKNNCKKICNHCKLGKCKYGVCGL